MGSASRGLRSCLGSSGSVRDRHEWGVLLMCICFWRGLGSWRGFYSASSDYSMEQELYKVFQHPVEWCSKGLWAAIVFP